MKRIFFIVLFLVGAVSMNAQGFKAGIAGGYISELEGIGVSADLIYELNEKWGVSNTTTFSVVEDRNIRTKWLALDLNGRYKIVDELYAIAGVEMLSLSYKNANDFGILTGSGDIPPSSTEFGGNLGAGYKINLIDNVNLFGEVKYTFIDNVVLASSGYIHARLGLLFDF
tara:strand:- start:31332 stop:31841 length:510 start_codon:yes stop_codon:yes gene_type:complete